MTKPIKTAPAVTSVTVQGQVVDARLIASYKKSFGKHEQILSVWANAATVQLAQHGNRNWIDSLFQLPVMTVKNGSLSKLGLEVFGYIRAHFPRLVWDKEHNKLALTKLQKDSILATHFVAVGASAESETVVQLRDKFYSAHGDFALTFTEFKNLEKPEVEKEEVAPKMTAVAFAKQADKALECFKDNRFVGTEEEILAAMLKAKALFLALDAQLVAQEKAKLDKLAEEGKAASAADVVDTDAAAKLLETGRKGKSARIGGKVQPALATAI
ncbi:hypothetical protein HOV23_gp126 [Pseudomonas phage Lana]|uniref:Uncharacterized protein n=1 Tax=Pseudomonas phage Lana TaxID=2530172 RepID=A0A481W6F3_9CAUD|nr:hypothetical protein HOV23_gp126 [Pseudomonas phage Lana]QBJ04447.1 hypothetical protein [Pseudomonas phage Lana]